MHMYKSYQVKVKSVQYQRKSLMLMTTLNLMLTLRFEALIWIFDQKWPRNELEISKK